MINARKMKKRLLLVCIMGETMKFTNPLRGLGTEQFFDFIHFCEFCCPDLLNESVSE